MCEKIVWSYDVDLSVARTRQIHACVTKTLTTADVAYGFRNFNSRPRQVPLLSSHQSPLPVGLVVRRLPRVTTRLLLFAMSRFAFVSFGSRFRNNTLRMKLRIDSSSTASQVVVLRTCTRDRLGPRENIENLDTERLKYLKRLFTAIWFYSTSDY